MTGFAASAALGYKDWTFAVIFWLFAVFIQIGTNFHNDYSDFIKGADTEKRVGQARATQKGWLKPEEVSFAALLVVGVAAVIGAYLTGTQESGSFGFKYMVFVTITSCFNSFAYTGGEFPLGYVGLGWVSIGYSGLGDLFVFLYFGIVATITPFVLQTGTTPPPFLWAVVMAVAGHGTAIIVVNNVRDRHQDCLVKKRTLAVLLGGTFCRVEYTCLILYPYVIVAAFSYAAHQNLLREFLNTTMTLARWWVWLLPCFTLPLALSHIRNMWTLDGGNLNPFVGGTAKLQLQFCVLLSFSICFAS